MMTVAPPTTSTTGSTTSSGSDAWENIFVWNEKYSGALEYTPDYAYCGIALIVFFFGTRRRRRMLRGFAGGFERGTGQSGVQERKARLEDDRRRMMTIRLRSSA